MWDRDDLEAALAALAEEGWSERHIREFLTGAPWRHREELRGSALKLADVLAEGARVIGDAELEQGLALVVKRQAPAEEVEDDEDDLDFEFLDDVEGVGGSGDDLDSGFPSLPLDPESQEIFGRLTAPFRDGRVMEQELAGGAVRVTRVGPMFAVTVTHSNDDLDCRMVLFDSVDGSWRVTGLGLTAPRADWSSIEPLAMAAALLREAGVMLQAGGPD